MEHWNVGIPRRRETEYSKQQENKGSSEYCILTTVFFILLNSSVSWLLYSSL
jgi:hypothetical protein